MESNFLGGERRKNFFILLMMCLCLDLPTYFFIFGTPHNLKQTKNMGSILKIQPFQNSKFYT